MTNSVSRAVSAVAYAVIELHVKKAIAYLTPEFVVKATNRVKRRKNEKTVEVVVTVGKPNFKERQFIRDCQRAGEKFPLKRLQYLW